jgi:hypothetical protein
MANIAWSSSTSLFDSRLKVAVTFFVSGRFDGTLPNPADIGVVSAGAVRVVEAALKTCITVQLIHPQKLPDLNAALGVELAPELARVGAQGQVVIEKLALDERSRAAVMEANAALAAARRKEMMEKMAQQEAAAAAPPKTPKPAGVECSKCGARTTGKFCVGCGASLYTAVPVRLSFPNPAHCVVEDGATGQRHIDRVELEGVLHTPYADGANLLENNVADVIYVLLKEQIASGAWSAAAIESGALGAELCRAIAARYEALGDERYIPMSTIEVTSVRIKFSPAKDGALALETHVLVQWSDGNRYPGILQQTAQGQSLVAFPNGTTQWVPTHTVTKA